MKLIKIFNLITIILILNISFAIAKNCNKFDKLSKHYAKCTSDNLKDKTSIKANELKTLTKEKIKEGKKKFNITKLKEKLVKFKNSKTLKEFVEK